MNPGNIVRNVVDRRDTFQCVRLVVGEKHKTKSDVVSGTVSTLCKRLSSEAVSETVDPVVSDGPGVTCSDASWVTPHLRRYGVRVSLRQRLTVTDQVHPKENALLAG